MTATDTVEVPLEGFGQLEPASRTGGQGRVHRPQRQPSGLSGDPLVVKLYRRPPGGEAAATLREMVRWERTLDAPERGRLRACAAWPLALVEDRGRTVGIAMRDVRGEYAVPFTMPSGRTDRVLLGLEHLLGGDGFLRQRGLGVLLDTATRARVAERISGALELLHRHAIAVGDLAPTNVLVAFGTDGPRVCLIDCDSMAFRGRQALAAVETGDWNLPAPFAEPPGTRAADGYKLGLVVLRLFARSHDARTLAPHLRHVPVELRDLLHRALAADATNRPPAGEWQWTLQRLLGDAGLAERYPGPVVIRPAGAPLPAPARRSGSAPLPAPAPLLARRPGGSPRLRRAVAVLWLVAVAAVLGVLLARLAAPAPGPRIITTYYPQARGGLVVPSVGRAVPAAGQP